VRSVARDVWIVVMNVRQLRKTYLIRSDNVSMLRLAVYSALARDRQSASRRDSTELSLVMYPARESLRMCVNPFCEEPLRTRTKGPECNYLA
jgi:hypothetical protein